MGQLDQTIKRGDRFVAYADLPLRQRLFLTVTRVARDRTWADIRVQNCYVMWTKRQVLDDRGLPPGSVFADWDQSDLDRQAEQWDAWIRT